MGISNIRHATLETPVKGPLNLGHSLCSLGLPHTPRRSDYKTIVDPSISRISCYN